MSQSHLTNVSNREFSIVRLLIVGKLACARGDYEEAVRLFGAAETLRNQFGYLLEPLPHAEYEEAVASVRAQLHAAAYETLWMEGYTMTEAEATTSALGYAQTQIAVNDTTERHRNLLITKRIGKASSGILLLLQDFVVFSLPIF